MARTAVASSRFVLSGTVSLVCSVLAMTLAGCGSSGEYSTVTVKGSVTYLGQPVTGGALTFLPTVSGGGGGAKAGKPASGTVRPDGSFTMGTYAASDGVTVGKQRVMYSPPTVELPAGKTLKEGEFMPRSPYDGLVPKVTEVTIEKGGNSALMIELVPAPGAMQVAPGTANAGRM